MCSVKVECTLLLILFTIEIEDITIEATIEPRQIDLYTRLTIMTHCMQQMFVLSKFDPDHHDW